MYNDDWNIGHRKWSKRCRPWESQHLKTKQNKKIVELLFQSSRSAPNIVKMIGDRIPPWGTPDSRFLCLDIDFPILTLCFLVFFPSGITQTTDMRACQIRTLWAFHIVDLDLACHMRLTGPTVRCWSTSFDPNFSPSLLASLLGLSL